MWQAKHIWLLEGNKGKYLCSQSRKGLFIQKLQTIEKRLIHLNRVREYPCNRYHGIAHPAPIFNYLPVAYIYIVQFRFELSRSTYTQIFFFNLFFGCTGSLLLCTGFSLVAVSGGYFSLRCAGFSLGGFSCGARALGTWASVVVALGLSSCGSRALEHRLSSCGTRAQSVACGIFLDQGSNLRALHWQADS